MRPILILIALHTFTDINGHFADVSGTYIAIDFNTFVIDIVPFTNWIRFARCFSRMTKTTTFVWTFNPFFIKRSKDCKEKENIQLAMKSNAHRGHTNNTTYLIYCHQWDADYECDQQQDFVGMSYWPLVLENHMCPNNLCKQWLRLENNLGCIVV